MGPSRSPLLDGSPPPPGAPTLHSGLPTRVRSAGLCRWGVPHGEPGEHPAESRRGRGSRVCLKEREGSPGTWNQTCGGQAGHESHIVWGMSRVTGL